MEHQETPLHHGAPHNLVLLLIFIVGIALLGFSVIKLTHPTPKPAPKAPVSKNPVTVTKKGGVTIYTDHEGGFSFTYPSDIKVNDDGVFKYDTLNLNYMPFTDIERKLGNDFPPDHYASLAAAITNGTKFQPVRTTKNITYPIRTDFETVKIGNRYFVRDFPVTNKDCNCTQIQYVTVVGKYFVSYSMAKGFSTAALKTINKTATVTPALSSSEYRQLLLTNKETLIKRAFPNLEATLATLKED